MSDFAILDRGSMALPSTAAKGQFLRVDSVTGTTTLWDGVNTILNVPLVANAGAFTADDSGNYIAEITGVLTAAGNIVATFAANPLLLIVDNAATGAFALTINALYSLPKGKSVWYWNGATLELTTQNNAVVSGTLDLGANALIAVASPTAQKILVNTLPGAPATQVGGLTDAVNSRFVIPVGQDGRYRLDSFISFSNVAAGNVSGAIYLNGALLSQMPSSSAGAGLSGYVYDSETFDLKAGDIIELYALAFPANNTTLQTADTHMTLTKLGAV